MEPGLITFYDVQWGNEPVLWCPEPG